MTVTLAAGSLLCGLAAGWILNRVIIGLCRHLQNAIPVEEGSLPETHLNGEPVPSPEPIPGQRFHPGKNQGLLSAVIIQLLTALLWFWAFTHYDFPEAVLFVAMTGILTVITWVDSKTMFIPLSMILSGLGTLIIYQVFYPDHLKPALWGVVAGFGYLGGIMLLTSLLFRKQTMGYGDLQLIVILGAWLGAINVLMAILAAALISLIVWLALSLKRGFDRNRPLPFGPFLSIAGVMMYIISPNWEQILSFLS